MNFSFTASICNNCIANENYTLKNPMSGEVSSIPPKTCVKSIFIYVNNPVTENCSFSLGILSNDKNKFIAYDDINIEDNIDTNMLNSGTVHKMIPLDISTNEERKLVIIFDKDFVNGEISFLFNCVSV